MIARISAYSAAEAPESSRSMLMKVFIYSSFHKHPRPPVDTDFLLRADREDYAELRPRTRWNRVKKASRLLPPERSAAHGVRLG
jgi:hypothetical protein